MTKRSLGITGLLAGLALWGALGGLPAAHAAGSPDPVSLRQLGQTLDVLDGTLAQARLRVASPNQLDPAELAALTATLNDIERTLAGIKTALGPAPAAAGAPQQIPAPVEPPVATAPESPIVDDEPAPAGTANLGLISGDKFSLGKIAAALVILVGGAGLIALSLRKPRPRSSVAVHTEAARASENSPIPGLGKPPSDGGSSGGEPPQEFRAPT